MTHLSIGLIERRLVDQYGPNALARKKAPAPSRHPVLDTGSGFVPLESQAPDQVRGDEEGFTARGAGSLAYEVIGTPNDLDSALKLAEYFAGLRPKVPLQDRQAAYKKAARDDGASRQGSLI